MTENYRPSNPIAEGFMLLTGLGRDPDEVERRDRERRSKMTKGQRLREDATGLVFCAGVFVGIPALVFGPWLVGAWVLLRSLFGSRP